TAPDDLPAALGRESTRLAHSNPITEVIRRRLLTISSPSLLAGEFGPVMSPCTPGDSLMDGPTTPGHCIAENCGLGYRCSDPVTPN
ncbi:MAG: hypothetical protein ACRDJH_25085, partial [Thermomicrobiales bacterium]